MTTSIFPDARGFSIHGSEFCHVRGNQTKMANYQPNNMSGSFNRQSVSGSYNTQNITGSYNTQLITGPHSNRDITGMPDPKSRETKTKYKHRNSMRMNSRSHQENSRADNESLSYPRNHYYGSQEEQDYYHTSPPTRQQQYGPHDPPKLAPIPLDNRPSSPLHRESGFEYENDASDGGLSHQIMAPVPRATRYEPVARHANGARPGLSHSGSQHIPVQDRYESAFRRRMQPLKEEEGRYNRNHDRGDRNEVLQSTLVRATQHQDEDWEEQYEDAVSSLSQSSHEHIGSITSHRTSSRDSRVGSTIHSPTRTPSPLPSSPRVSHPIRAEDGNDGSTSSLSETWPGVIRKDSKLVAVPLPGEMESPDPDTNSLHGGRCAAGKTELKSEETKRKKLWTHKLLNWRKNVSKDTRL
ncbi:hypothetical protein PQX77_015546 [Marasmius sp. AFHP31]|nr:hypothetical protein PQX77_015546 [Marasmius sp. AFHP31]